MPDNITTPEEVAKELGRIGQEFKELSAKQTKEFETAVKDKADTKDIEAIKHDMLEKTEQLQEAIDKVTKAAEAQGVRLNELSEAGKKAESRKSGRELLAEQLTAKAAEFLAMKDNKFAQRNQIVTKVAGDMSTANILPGTALSTPYSLISGNDGIIAAARRQPFIREVLGSRPINSMYAFWVDAINADGGPTPIAEAAAKPQIDTDFQEATRKVEKIAGYAKMSKELLADVAGMQAFIEEEIQTLVELKLDDQLYSGNGATPNLKGLTSWGTTLSVAGTAFALGVEQANNFDVIIAGQSIMQATYKFNPNVVFVNPIDLGMMMTLKASTSGVYQVSPYADALGLQIAGIRIISNPGVTAGDFVLMDSTKPRLRMREEFNIDYGYDGNDFTKNLITVLGELRAVLYLPTNYAGAVLKGTFATLKTAMETA